MCYHHSTAFVFLKADGVRRGQSIVALTTRGSVETGIISLVSGEKIETNLVQSRLPYGTTVISTLGDIIGMHVTATEQSGAQFISTGQMLGAVDAYLSSEEPNEEEDATI